MSLRDWLLTAWFAPEQLRPTWKLLWRLFLLLAWPLSLITKTVSDRRRQSRVRIQRRAGSHAGPVVIVVGNLVVGGAGKTPVVIALLDALRAAGLHAGVIARGYKGAATGRPGLPTGDEAQLIQLRCAVPVHTHPDRLHALQSITLAHPDLEVVVSDDGLQHVGLPRDLEIVLIDPRGLGNGMLLPAGPLRESAQALLQADAIVLSKGAQPELLDTARLDRTRLFSSNLEIVGFRQLTNPGTVIDTATFSALIGQAGLAALAGIATPASFFAAARKELATSFISLSDSACLALEDHANINESVLSAHLHAHGAATLLMTEKDLVKCDPRWACASACWALVICATLPAELITSILNNTHQLLGQQGHGPTSA